MAFLKVISLQSLIYSFFTCFSTYLEVSSPGIEKPLKTFEQVEAHVGSYVHIDLKNPKNGIDSLEGTLASIDGQELLIQYMVKAVRKKMTINYDDIIFIRLAVKF